MAPNISTKNKRGERGPNKTSTNLNTNTNISSTQHALGDKSYTRLVIKLHTVSSWKRPLSKFASCATAIPTHPFVAKHTYVRNIVILSPSWRRRFDRMSFCDLVGLVVCLPYVDTHVSQEEERAAEAELSRRDPDRPARLWVHGHGAFSTSSPHSEEKRDKEDREDTSGGTSPSRTPQAQAQAQEPSTKANQGQGSSSVVDEQQPARRSEERTPAEMVEAAGLLKANSQQSRGKESEPDLSGGGSEGLGKGEVEAGGGGAGKGAGTPVPDFRLNGFVFVCPLVSEGCKFTAKAWLQDEDD